MITENGSDFKNLYFGKKNFQLNIVLKNTGFRDFPGGTVVKNPPANAGDMGSSPDPGRFHMLRSN